MKLDKICGIYCIENTINNKKYIGQSIDIYSRWSKHKSELNHENHHNDFLQKAWSKYGEDYFRFYILECCDKELLNEKERYYIDKYNALEESSGYNLKEGGQDSGAISDYSKAKKSESLKRNYLDNPELIDLRRKNAISQWNNPEIKSKILGENNGMYGRHHSEESKRKMSESAKGRVSKRRNTNKVFCRELQKTFECAAEAAKLLHINNSSQILQTCYGNRKTWGGYHWEFVMENN